MKAITPLFLALASCLSALAGMPQLKTLPLYCDPYVVWPNGSNAVITVWKSTSLGTVFTPFKPAGVFPASRTNFNIPVLPGTYHTYLTATVQPYGQSTPSNMITNLVNP